MAINFPDSPSVNDTYTVGDRTWVWDGTTWTVIVGGVPTSISEFNITGDLNVGQDAEVDGILTANHIHGNIAGSVYLHVKNTSGSEIAAGTPVYATGSVGASGATEVSPSDASTAGTMPAVGITQSTLAINAEGHVTILGVIGSQDTSTYSLNDSVYVAPGGGLTSTRPTSATDLVQKIARVVRVDGSSGELLVLGAGRANDVPNEISISGDLTVDTDTLHVDSTSDRVGIGTTSPAAALDVNGAISVATDSGAVATITSEGSAPNIGLALEKLQGSGDLGHWNAVSINGNDNVSYESRITWAFDSIAEGPIIGGLRTSTSSTDLTFHTTESETASERMRITSSGNVGIGTTSPASPLHVEGNIRTSTDSYVNNGAGEGLYIDGTNNKVQLNTGGTSHLTVDGGNVGIGITSPGADLHIASGATELQLQDSDGVLGGSMTARVRMTDGSGSIHGTVGFSATSSGIMIVDNNDGPLFLRTLSADDIVFYTNTVERMRVDESAGSVNVTDKFFVSGASTITFDGTNGTYPKLGNYSSSTDNLEVGSLGGIDFVIDSNGNTSEVFNWRSGGSAGAGALLMQLNESGSLGVGRVANTYSLTAGSAEFHGTVMCDSNNTTTPFYVGRYTSTAEAIGISVADRDGYIYMNQDETSGAAYLHLSVNGQAGSTQRIYMDDNLYCGFVSKSSGSFTIDHPIPEMTDTHYLRHSFVEGPQADNLYRGRVQLENGTAVVNIDTASNMTEGTFVLLNRDIQCFTSNEEGPCRVWSSIEGNLLTINAEHTDCSHTISWMVIGERQDAHMYDTDWTDDEGRIIVEPEKDDPAIAPRTWLQHQEELANQEAN